MAVEKGTFDNVLAGKTRSKSKAQGKKSAPQPKGSKTTMPLADIKDRPHGDTRQLNEEHVTELAESIAAVGLIQPIAVDSQGHLLAGGHRRDAIQLIGDIAEKKKLPIEIDLPKAKGFSTPLQYFQTAWKQHFPDGNVPVRVFDFDASQDPDRLLEIEATENFQRKDYSREEVRAIATRLRDAGYVEQAGRVRKGTKRLRPALATITGKSIRTITRYLAEVDEPSSDPIEPSVPIELIPKHVRALKRLEKDFSEHDAIAKQAAKLRRMLKKLEG